VRSLELARVSAGTVDGVLYVEVVVEGAEDAPISIDGVDELDGTGAGEADGTGQVAGDGVRQVASTIEIEGVDEGGGGRACLGDRGGRGEVEGVGIGEDDGAGVRMHEVDCLPARPGASGEVVGESAAEGTNVDKVADDVDEHVEDCRGEYLRHDGGLLGVDGDCLPQRGAAQLVRMGLPRTKPQF